MTQAHQNSWNIPINLTWSYHLAPCRLLHSGLFHLVRDQPSLLSKVHLLKGDLLSTEPDLGIPQTRGQAGARPPAAAARGGADGGVGMDDDAVVLNVLEEGAQSSGRAAGAGEPQGPVEQEMTQRSSHAATAAAAPVTGGVAGGSGQAWSPDGGGEVYGSMDMLRGEPRLLVIHSAARIALDDPIQVG
jgi:hypothetical protein